MVTRSFDGELFKEALARAPEGTNEGFDHQAHLDDHDHILLVNDNRDVGYFCHEYPGVYTGHWFFLSRGKEAKQVAKEMLDYAFANHNVRTIRGVTKVDMKAARWMACPMANSWYDYNRCVLGCRGP